MNPSLERIKQTSDGARKPRIPMKTALLFLTMALLAGCQNASSQRSRSASKFAGVDQSTFTSQREEKISSLETETEARAKTYQKRGYSVEESRALARAEYFRAGK